MLGSEGLLIESQTDREGGGIMDKVAFRLTICSISSSVDILNVYHGHFLIIGLEMSLLIINRSVLH